MKDYFSIHHTSLPAIVCVSIFFFTSSFPAVIQEKVMAKSKRCSSNSPMTASAKKKLTRASMKGKVRIMIELT